MKANFKTKRPAIKNTFQEMWQCKHLYAYLLPFFMIFFVFTVLPVIIAIYYSFTYYNILQPPVFLGIKNYVNLFVNDDIFIKAVINTFFYAVITGPGGFFASLIVAWVINEFSPRLRAVLIVLFYAPSISGQLYMMWSLLFSGDSYGYVNSMLIQLGFISEPVQWLTNPTYMMPIIIVVSLWMSLGAGFLSMIAGLQGVDRSLYEAAQVDGIRNRWQELWYITLPMLKNQLMFSAVMSITASFSSAGVMTALAGFPSTDYAAHTIIQHLEDYGQIRFEMGYACAIATVLFVFMMSANAVVQKMLRRVGQ